MRQAIVAATLMALVFGSATSAVALEKGQAESAKKIITLKGTLERKDMSGGFWAMTVKDKNYDLHGDDTLFVDVAAGDMVTVKGTIDAGGVCIHMYGTIVNVKSIAKSNAGGK